MSARPTSLLAMRLLATGLLVLMVAIFVAARRYEDMHPVVGFVRAFAEAATVGALADWFAVTALFRRPLGLPIPHTAIIPRSKDRIGAGLGRFLETNFLSADLLTERLAKIDLLGEAAKWLLQPDRARAIARGAAESLPRFLDLVDDAPVETALKDFAGVRLREADLPTLLADVLAFLTAKGRHQGLLDYLLRAADALLNESEEDIRHRIRAQSGFLARILSLDKQVSDSVVGAARTAIHDLATRPESDIRQRFDNAIARLIDDLRFSADLRAEVDALKARLLDQPDVQAFAGALWKAVKKDLQDRAGRDDDTLAGPLQGAIEGFARRVTEDAQLRDLLNERLRGWIVRLADARGGDVSRFVAETIQGWDASTIIKRIEEGVGADLQFIRISGTLVGGLVGLILHTLDVTLLA